MSTLYQSSKDVPTEVLAARLNELADVVAQKRDRIGAEFTMRIPAEVDRDADLVMSEAAVRLEALQAECEKLRNLAAECAEYLSYSPHTRISNSSVLHRKLIDAAMQSDPSI